MQHTFELVIGAIFINNILLAKFLGNCPFLGVSKKMDTAIGMSLGGLKPIAEMQFSGFSYLMIPQLEGHASRMRSRTSSKPGDRSASSSVRALAASAAPAYSAARRWRRTSSDASM